MKKVIKNLKEAVKNFWLHETTIHASAFAYTAILSLPALILMIVFLVKLVVWNSEAIQSSITDFSQTLPWESGEILVQFLNNDVSLTGFWTGIITVALLFWSGTKLIAFFSQAINNSLWLKLDKDNAGLWYMLKIRGFWILFILVFIISIFASVIAWSLIWQFFWNTFMLSIINFAISLSVYSILFAFVMKFMLLIKVDYKQALAWGLLLGFLTVIGTSIMSIIFGLVDFTSDFAVWASVILFLIWINYLWSLIFFGFEIINVYLREAWELVIRTEWQDKYKRDIDIKASPIAKIAWAAKVLKTEAKVAWWGYKKFGKKK